MPENSYAQLKRQLQDHARHQFLDAVSQVCPECPLELQKLLELFQPEDFQPIHDTWETFSLRCSSELKAGLKTWAEKFYFVEAEWIYEWALHTLQYWKRNQQARKKLRWKHLRSAEWNADTEKLTLQLPSVSFSFEHIDGLIGEKSHQAKARIKRAFDGFLVKELKTVRKLLIETYGQKGNHQKFRLGAKCFALHQMCGLGASRTVTRLKEDGDDLFRTDNRKKSKSDQIQENQKYIQKGVREFAKILGLTPRILKPGRRKISR